MAVIEITRVIAPGQARVGDPIHVEVDVRNNGSETYDVAITGSVIGISGTDFYIYSYPLTVPPGGEPGLSISSAFIMPNVPTGIGVKVNSWYRLVGTVEWTFSDERYFTISVTTKQYLGKIINKKLRVYSTDHDIPVSEIMPVGVSASLRITARNDMSSYQKLGISYTVDCGSWSFAGTEWGWSIAPGSTIEIDSSSFVLEPAGIYYILLDLLSEDGHILDTYSGILCTVQSGGGGKASFDFLTPSLISSAILSSVVTISLPIKNTSGRTVAVIPKATMFEGSVLPSPGSQIGSIITLPSISFNADEQKPVTFTWKVAGALDRKDVMLELYEGVTFISSNHYDDIIRYVTVAQYTIQLYVVPANSGTATKSPEKPSYNSGDVITLTAKPATGYVFDYWDSSGKYLDNKNLLTLAVKANLLLTAHFRKSGAPPTKPPSAGGMTTGLIIGGAALLVVIVIIAGAKRRK